MTQRPLIELGWVLVGRFDPPDRRAVRAVRERIRETLASTFPEYEWRMPLAEREAVEASQRKEVVDLLEHGVVERQARNWDFALVVTGGDLRSYYQPFALGAPARALSVAVMSTARLDPRSSDRTVELEERIEVMTRRLHALALHLLGHLGDLVHATHPKDYTYNFETVADLDRMERYSATRREQLGRELADVADLRLEEETEASPNPVVFYLRAAWRERSGVLGAIRRARGWQLPFRLGRLTAAAFSALALLLVTAEVWDLGMSQPPRNVVMLSLLVLVMTSIYLLARQRLLVHRDAARLSELTVVTNVSTVVSITLGMATAYAVLFGLALLVAKTVFPATLVASWAVSLGGRIELVHYLVFSAFVASLGLLIGALGASFEEQRYFHHVAYVDEET